MSKAAKDHIRSLAAFLVKEENIMKMKKLAALVLAAACTLSLAGCGGASNGDAVAAIKKAGKITMVCNAEFNPFEYKEGDEITGIDIDISKAVADDLGVKLEIQDIDFAACIPSVKTGKADFSASGFTVTEDRKKNVDFSDTYFEASQNILVAKDSTIAKAADLNDKVVGVQQGTTGDTYCTNEDGSSEVKVKEVKRYNKFTDAVADLVAGRLDAVVVDNFPAKILAEKNADTVKLLDEPLTEEEYAIVVPKDSNLKDEINKVLKQKKEDGSLDEIFAKYITVE